MNFFLIYNYFCMFKCVLGDFHKLIKFALQLCSSLPNHFGKIRFKVTYLDFIHYPQRNLKYSTIRYESQCRQFLPHFEKKNQTKCRIIKKLKSNAKSPFRLHGC
jgi:hypothetical protein